MLSKKFRIVIVISLLIFTLQLIRAQSTKGDLNNDGKVDIIDLGILLSSWGRTDKPLADINQDGKVDIIDLGILLSNWGGTTTTTTTTPQNPVCGNGIQESGEQCDDGNNINGDGCSSTCQLETTGTVIRVPKDYSSIQQAINAAKQGDTILVSPGTYGGALTINKGVILRAEQYDSVNPKNNPTIIDGQGAQAVITIPSGVASMPRITGFKIIRAANDGISPRSPFIVEYSYFTNAKDLIDYEKGSGGITRNNIFENAGDDALDLDNQINDLLIENNILLNSNQDGIEIRLQPDVLQNEIKVTIRNNQIKGSGQDGIQFIDYATGPDQMRLFIVERNLIIQNTKAGIGMMDNEVTTEDLRAANVKERVHVFNNVFTGSQVGISGGDNVVAVNNIFSSNNLGLKNVDANSIVAHNLFWQSPQQGSNVQNAITADPKLDANYRPMSGSPAIDAGVATFVHNGKTVLNIPPSSYSGSAPDLGVYEVK